MSGQFWLSPLLACGLCLSLAPARAAPPESTLAVTGNQPDLTALLGRLREHESQLAQYNRTQHTSTEQELDGHGAVSDESVTLMQVTKWPDRDEVVVQRSTHNGKDETRERQEAFVKPHKDDVHLSAKSPFKPEEQPKYTFQIGGPEAGTTLYRIHFEPRVPKQDGQLIGDAWVDASAGAPVKMVAVPSKLPAHADKVNMTMEYHANTPAGPALSKLVVEGEGGFLFFHQKMRATLLVSDYQSVPR